VKKSLPSGIFSSKLCFHVTCISFNAVVCPVCSRSYLFFTALLIQRVLPVGQNHSFLWGPVIQLVGMTSMTVLTSAVNLSVNSTTLKLTFYIESVTMQLWQSHIHICHWQKYMFFFFLSCATGTSNWPVSPEMTVIPKLKNVCCGRDQNISNKGNSVINSKAVS